MPSPKRSRKRRASASARPGPHPTSASPAAPNAPSATGAAEEPKRRLRAEEKNANARAALVPLRRGERPRAVTVAAVVALLLAVVTIVTYLAGAELQNGKPAPLLAAAPQALLMLVMAWGLWRVRYWAVLGMQALLGLVIVVFSLSALINASALGLLIIAAVLIPALTLFWFLIKAMGRIQMPARQ